MLDSKEQLIWFLDKFNVVVSEEDVFSRCMVRKKTYYYLILKSDVFLLALQLPPFFNYTQFSFKGGLGLLALPR